MMNKKLVFLLVVGWMLATAVLAHAHGARINYTVSTTVTIVALYDSGEAMAGAQVTVYAPDDPATPWLTGVTDGEGRFSFTPDPAIPGTWDVQARQAGHGAISHIPIGENGATTVTTGFTPWQIALMSVSIVWGFVGVAAYFSRTRKS